MIEYGRPTLSREQIEDVATGRVFTAEQAVENGLVDDISFLDETIALLQSDLKLENARVIEYEHPPTLTDVLLGTAQAPGELTLLKQLFDSPSPRAFYMLGSTSRWLHKND